MYIVTCVRCGKYPRFNRKYKGEFKKEFKTLSELAIFMVKNRNSLCFPKLGSELNTQEVKILSKKVRSCQRKIKQS